MATAASLATAPARRARAVVAVVQCELLAGLDVMRSQDGHAKLMQQKILASSGLTFISVPSFEQMDCDNNFTSIKKDGKPLQIYDSMHVSVCACHRSLVLHNPVKYIAKSWASTCLCNT